MTLTGEYQYIGRSSAVKASNGANYYTLLYAKTSGDISTGKHTVSVKMYLACTESSSFYGFYTSGSVTVAGTSVFSWSAQQIPNAAWSSEALTAGGVTYKRWILLKEGNTTVNTGYGAAKDITIASKWKRHSIDGTIPSYLPGITEITVSITATLPMIASASVPTLSASSVVMGNTVTITTNRQSTALTHDLTYSFSGSTGTIATGVGDSYIWTVPDLVSKIPNQASGTCTITCKTKSGSTVIGTKTVTLTLTIPAKSSPTAAETVQMGKSVTINTNSKSAGYTHTLTYTVAGQTGDIGTGVTTSKEWTPPKGWAAATSNKTSISCTITCVTYNGTHKVGEATTKITLTVPDATIPKLSATTVDMGSTITISLKEEAEVYTHSLTYALKEYGESEAIATGDIGNHDGGDCVWTVPLDLAKKIPSDTKATVEIICKTLLGETLVGEEKVSFTATVPDNESTKPKVIMTLVPVHDLPDAFAKVYVEGKSKVKVSYEDDSKYSAIVDEMFTVAGKSGKEHPFTSDLLTTAGEVKVSINVTDTRDYSATHTESITVIDYSGPRIIPGESQSKIVCQRCNSDGSIDPAGVYLLVKIGRKYSKVISDGEQHNYCSLKFRWKTDAQDDTQYSKEISLLEPADISTDYVSKVLPDIVSSNTIAYNIQLIAEDDVGESDTETIVVPSAFATVHVPEGGHGFTLGGYHDPSKIDVFDCWFDAEFQGEVRGIYSYGETDGWHWVKYSDGLAQCWRRVDQSIACTAAWGSMFYATCDEVTFPFTFVEVPVCSITLEHAYSTVTSVWLAGYTRTTNEKTARVIAVSPVAGTVDGTISYHAIGRWKE